MRVLSKPTVKEFKLKNDPEGVATVTIRQAKFEQSRLRAEMFAKRRTIVHDAIEGEYAVEQDWNSWEIVAREIYLTLVGASGFLDEDGNEVFSFYPNYGGPKMSESAFSGVLGLFDEEIIREIHGYVMDMNPHWDASRQGE